MKLVRTTWVIAAAASLLIAATACNGGDDSGKTPTLSSSAPDSTETSPAATASVPKRLAGGGSGIASLDAIASAVLDRDYHALERLVQFAPVACTTTVK